MSYGMPAKGAAKFETVFEHCWRKTIFCTMQTDCENIIAVFRSVGLEHVESFITWPVAETGQDWPPRNAICFFRVSEGCNQSFEDRLMGHSPLSWTLRRKCHFGVDDVLFRSAAQVTEGDVVDVRLCSDRGGVH